VIGSAAPAADAAARRPVVRPDFGAADVTIVEPPAGSTVYAEFAVTLAGPPSHRTKLLVRTANRTARWNRGDYGRVTERLLFTPTGPLTQTVRVPVYGDGVVEGPETFELRMRRGTTVRVATVTIEPPAPPVTPLLATDTSVFEPAEGGLSDGTVTFAPTAPLAEDLSVDFEVVGVDAEAGVDFQEQAGTLTFPAGSTTPLEVVVTVVGDETIETDEVVRVELSVADASVTLAPSFATVTIVDDDAGGSEPPIDIQ
jgi:hypothetical protein